MKNNSKPTNVLDALAAGQKQLIDGGISSARLDSQLLLANVVGQSKAWLLSHPEYALTSRQRQHFEQLVSKRAKNIPVAYLLGYKEFYGRKFITTPDVLVPRPETEQLVEQILALGSNNDTLRVLDIGTGSGAIAVTLACERPNWQIYASDTSYSALEVVKANAKEHHVLDKISLIEQDLLLSDSQRYDIIAANLPYVPNHLRDKPDIAHEPDAALFAGADGLDLYRDLFSQLVFRTRQGNPVDIVVIESLTSQHAELTQIASLAEYELLKTVDLIQVFKHY